MDATRTLITTEATTNDMRSRTRGDERNIMIIHEITTAAMKIPSRKRGKIYCDRRLPLRADTYHAVVCCARVGCPNARRIEYWSDRGTEHENEARVREGMGEHLLNSKWVEHEILNSNDWYWYCPEHAAEHTARRMSEKGTS